MSELAVGQTVQLNDGRIATVRFVGQTRFAPDDWVGVELEDDTGKNDGSVKGDRYFDCEMGRGMFVRPMAITSIIEQPPPAAKPPNGSAAVKKITRPSSVGGSALGRRMSSVPDPGAGKRMSMNASSPSPAGRTSQPSSMLRVRYTILHRTLLIRFAVSHQISYQAAICCDIECFNAENRYSVQYKNTFHNDVKTSSEHWRNSNFNGTTTETFINIKAITSRRPWGSQSRNTANN